MKLSSEVKAIRAAWVARFGIPSQNAGEAGEAWEDRLRKQWTIPLCEQVAFQLPGQGWGVKRADPGRPIGKDSIARQVDGQLLVWDLLAGAGAGRPSMNDDPGSEDITGQFFETRPEYFQPRDHLGTVSGGEPPVPGPSQPPPSSDDHFEDDVRASLGRVEGELAALRQEHNALKNDHGVLSEQLAGIASKVPPQYEGKIPYFGPITLTPKA